MFAVFVCHASACLSVVCSPPAPSVLCWCLSSMQPVLFTFAAHTALPTSCRPEIACLRVDPRAALRALVIASNTADNLHACATKSRAVSMPHSSPCATSPPSPGSGPSSTQRTGAPSLPASLAGRQIMCHQPGATCRKSRPSTAITPCVQHQHTITHMQIGRAHV